MPNPQNIEKYKIKPGQRLPGAGRKKGPSVSTLLHKLLNQKVDAGELGKLKRSELLALKLMQLALGKGVRAENSLKAIQEILDRTEGKAVASLKLQGDQGNPVAFKVYAGFDPGKVGEVEETTDGPKGE